MSDHGEDGPPRQITEYDLFGSDDEEGQWNGRRDDQVFIEPSVMDSLIDSPLPIETRLQLQGTCKAYRDKLALFWTKPKLVLHPHDCTHRTAQYVARRIVGTDFEKGLNPSVELVFCDNNEGKLPTDESQRDTVLPKEWMKQQEASWDLVPADHARRVPYAVKPTISKVGGFFLGRLWARLSKGKAEVEIPDVGLIPFEHPLPRTEYFYQMNKIRLQQMTASQQAFLAGAYYKAAATDFLALCDRSPSKVRMLGFHMLDEAAAQQLARLSHPPGPPVLLTRGRSLSDPRAKYVIPKPSRFLGLRLLSLHATRNKLSHGLITPLVEGKVYTKNLKHLDLSYNVLSGLQRTQLIAGLGNVYKFSCLEKLSLNQVGMDDEDMRQLAPKFDDTPLNGLEVLQLSDNRFTTAGLDMFMKNACGMQNLKTLDMARMDINGTDLARFASWLVECAHWTNIATADLRPGNRATYQPADVKLVIEAVKIYKAKITFQRMCEAHNKRMKHKVAGVAPDLW